jgi:hypothetical protein
MSLDVSLYGHPYDTPCRCRDCGLEHTTTARDEIYSANITHNLREMAQAAGLYQVLWRPEELGITKASELVLALRIGLAWLESDPARFTPFNASNGWGLYEHFVPFVRSYLKACEHSPQATVVVSR